MGNTVSLTSIIFDALIPSDTLLVDMSMRTNRRPGSPYPYGLRHQSHPVYISTSLQRPRTSLFGPENWIHPP
jgi:hypothetical protein